MNRTRRALWLAPLAVLVVMLGASASAAGAATGIEGIWSFNGGEVAIHPGANGKLVGIVVAPTTFAECPHQAGEEMWTGMTLQADGSYWGFHQWLFEQTCVPNPVPGPTAWRILQTSAGTRSLEVCFSEPGKSQPTIAANGTSANASYGCKTSAPLAPLPVVASKGSGGGGTHGGERISFANTVILPKSSLCVKQNTLRIKIHEPAHDPLKKVVVKIKRHKIAQVSGIQRLKRGILLTGLPSGTYTLKITATTVLGQQLSGKRSYRGCHKARPKVRLHHPKRT
jgi:hypothetical protein